MRFLHGSIKEVFFVLCELNPPNVFEKSTASSTVEQILLLYCHSQLIGKHDSFRSTTNEAIQSIYYFYVFLIFFEKELKIFSFFVR